MSTLTSVIAQMKYVVPGVRQRVRKPNKAFRSVSWTKKGSVARFEACIYTRNVGPPTRWCSELTEASDHSRVLPLQNALRDCLQRRCIGKRSVDAAFASASDPWSSVGIVEIGIYRCDQRLTTTDNMAGDAYEIEVFKARHKRQKGSSRSKSRKG